MRSVDAASTIGPATNPAAAEHDVRPPLPQDLPARDRRAAGAEQRLQQRRRRLARQPGDLERVELVARLRNQPRLDAIRRPGERHVHAARVQRLGDGECRQHVSCRSPGRDHAPQLTPCGHDSRC
jgi:hypothetical protein